MENYRHIDSLLRSIQNDLNLEELLDVNLNIVKRDLIQPDCIMPFLASLKSKFSMQSRLTLAQKQGYENYKTTVFYCKTESESNAICKIDFDATSVNELFEKLDISDFFQETTLFAIVISKFNSPYIDDESPEIYVYATN